jgi:hypothetical protein
MRSPRLASPVSQQARRHPGSLESAAHKRRSSARNEHDLVTSQLELHLVAGLRLSLIAQALGDDDLPLCADPVES